MFSLLVTIISIMLVIALAAATVSYVADLNGTNKARAAAAALITQGQQIAAAGALTTSQGGTWPAEAPFFTRPYLSSMPIPPQHGYTQEAGRAASSDWTYYLPERVGPGAHHFVVLNKIRKDVCMEVNRLQGFIGIPAAWDGKTFIQCFGTADNPGKGYTFLYDPPGTSSGQKTEVLDKSVEEGGTGATPGYPRLCPDGSTLPNADAGLCAPGEGEGGGDSSQPGDSDTGYWVIAATAHPFYEDVTMTSGGHVMSCPAGSVNPAGPAATPLVTNSLETFSADGIMEMAWWGGSWDGDAWYPLNPTPLTRVWCIPASPEDVDPAWSYETYWSGTVKDVALATSYAGVDPSGAGAYTASAVGTLVAKGVTWSMVASIYEVYLSDSSLPAGSDDPYVEGRKVAIGRGAPPNQTFYGNAPANPFYSDMQSSTYGGQTGTLQFRDMSQPVVYSIAPTTGPLAGNTSVTITGKDFTASDEVYFGPNMGWVTTVTPTTIWVQTPAASSAGSVDVRIRNVRSGLSAILPSAFLYKDPDLLESSTCNGISANSAPSMTFSTIGAPMNHPGGSIMTLVANANGELPVRIKATSLSNRGQEAYDTYLSKITSGSVDGTPVAVRTTLVSVTPGGNVDFDAWMPKSAFPTTNVPVVKLHFCGEDKTVSTFTGSGGRIVARPANDCLHNVSGEAGGTCVRTTVNSTTGNLVFTTDWWLRGVFHVPVYNAPDLTTVKPFATAMNCVPRAWLVWWWDDSTFSKGSGAGLVECTGLYSQIKSFAANGDWSGVGKRSGIPASVADWGSGSGNYTMQNLYEYGATNVPYLGTYSGQGALSYYYAFRAGTDWTGSADCAYKGCINGGFLGFGTVAEFETFSNAVMRTRAGASSDEAALTVYICRSAAKFASMSTTYMVDDSLVAQANANAKASSCYRMVNFNEVPPQ